MPKIIHDIQQIILEEAKKQTLENGYTSMTIRSVAKSCGIAIGTIYNYYPSKDMLIASFMLADWMDTLLEMEDGCANAKEHIEAFKNVYEKLLAYISLYSVILENGSGIIRPYRFHHRHQLLRAQISSIISRFCNEDEHNGSNFLADFIAESLLAWSLEKRDFSDIENVLVKLF